MFRGQVSRIDFFGPCFPGSPILGWQPAIEELAINVRWQGDKHQCRRLRVQIPFFVTVTMSPELVETLRCLPLRDLPPQGDVLLTNTLPYNMTLEVISMTKTDDGAWEMLVEREHKLGPRRQAKICTDPQKHSRHVRIAVEGWEWTGTFCAAATGSFPLCCFDNHGEQRYLWIHAEPTSSNVESAGGTHLVPEFTTYRAEASV